jgi:hypothetical protein
MLSNFVTDLGHTAQRGCHCHTSALRAVSHAHYRGTVPSHQGVMQNMENVFHVKARSIEALQFRELALPESLDFR